MKKVSFVVLFVVVWVFVSYAQNSNLISKTENPKGWTITTKSSAYQLIITAGGSVKPGYYSSKEQADFITKNSLWQESIDEVPVRGALPYKTPVLEVVFADQVRDAELEYVSGEITTIDNRQTLKIIQKDKVYPLEVTSFIRVLPEYDILEKWIEIKNTSKKDQIKVENLLSGSIVLPADEYVLTQLSGKDINEFQLFESTLSPGLKLIQNKAFKSNQNAPWFQLQPQKTSKMENGATWFGSVHYSGNWSLSFDKSFNGPVQVLGGINFWDTEWNLKPGTTLKTPKFSVGFSGDGAEAASQSLRAYVKNEVLPAVHRNDLRPVIYNSWEADYYRVNEKQQLELAETAKDLGVELFTIDDGWFRGRTDGRSQSGLGNWDVDKTKFPRGLTPVINRVHELGMKFGLWIEPENVNPNSDVAMAHPGWIFQYPTRKGNVYRKILNLANEDAYQYLLKTFTALLNENDIDFIKWDQNNSLSEPGWQGGSEKVQREARIRHINNVYRLVDELRKRFPKVLFETCSGGGGRVDLGMLSRMDVAWPSDNTDPLDRLYIQYGYLSALPANTMVSWVTSTTRHQPLSLDFRFDVSMSGVLGMGNDIRKWTPAEKEIAKKKIALYKLIRPLVQQGVLYRLVSPFENNRCALQYNNDAKAKSSVVFCYSMAKYLPGSMLIDRGSSVLKLKGLNSDIKYRITKAGDTEDKGQIYSGAFLMDIGITWPVKNAFESQILLINEVNQ